MDRGVEVAENNMKRVVSENTKVTINLGILVTLLVFIISLTITAVGWKTKLESRVLALEHHRNAMMVDYSSCRDEVQRVHDRQLEQDAIFAEIRTDLKWIRVVMEETLDD